MANTVLSSLSNANMLDRPLYLQAKTGDAAVSYTGSDFRYLTEAAFPNQGVVGAAAFAVTQNGSGDGTINIAAGTAVIDGDGASNLGAYLVKSGGTVNLAVPAAPTSTTRVDRVIIRVRDSQVVSGTDYDWTLEVLEDTGSGTPAEPNSAITLAYVTRVGTTAVLTAAIADKRTRADLDPAQPWGIIGGKSYANSASAIGGTFHDYTLVYDSGPVTTVAGRRYRVRAKFLSEVSANNATDIFFIVKDTSGGPRVCFQVAEARKLGTSYGNDLIGEYDETAGGVHTFYLGGYQWSGGGGADHTITVYRHQSVDTTTTHLSVEDIGPASALTVIP